MAVNPPVFLSEEEGRQVILQEVAKAGLSFTPDALTFQAVLPAVSCNLPPERWGLRVGTLTLDGTDAARRVSYEFVSGADAREWTVDEPQASFWGVDVIGTAVAVRDGLGIAQRAETVGLFYEPAVHMDVSDEAWFASWGGGPPIDWEAKAAEAKERDREELRARCATSSRG